MTTQIEYMIAGVQNQFDITAFYFDEMGFPGENEPVCVQQVLSRTVVYKNDNFVSIRSNFIIYNC